MTSISLDELRTRLRDFEDAFIERKPEGAGTGEFRKTVVAFANSVRLPRTGVLYIGVSDDGNILGVANPDSLQKSIRRICREDCYPAVDYHCEVLVENDRRVVAVVIGESAKKPHFSGPAYVRMGSESVSATSDLYEELILSRLDKCRAILRERDARWTVRSFGRSVIDPQPLERFVSNTLYCTIVDCNAHYVTLRPAEGGKEFSLELPSVSLSRDHQRNAPMMLVRVP